MTDKPNSNPNPSPVRISKALPPINPLRGSSYVLPKKPEPIDWAHWQLMPMVKLQDAVALSVNVNPDYVTKVDDVLIKRMKIALSHVDAGSLPLEQHYANQPMSSVSLGKFAAWAVKLNIPNLPPELVAMATTATTTEPVAAPAQNTATPAPVEGVGASGGVEPAKAGPLPLTTGDIAFCFAGLRWKTETEWKKPLGDKPKWLAACIVIPGVQGMSETRWSPVCIGAALVRAGHAKPNSVRAKFQTQPLLTPWLDNWKTYEADNSDSN